MKKPLDLERSLAGKRIFITGHTGFTGGWACLWLKSMGVEAAGYSLAPDTKPSLFEAARLAEGMRSTFADICD